MCLNSKTIFQNEETAQRVIDGNGWEIADKNIRVYKILTKKGKNYISPYRGTLYQKGTHYYQVGKWCTASVCLVASIYQIEINEGLHSYSNKYFAEQQLSDGEVIVSMIIPKGSYIEWGMGGDVASSALIWY